MKENNKFWVQIPVNLIGIKDEGILKILIQLKHLENIGNTKVSHQFLSDVTNMSVSSMKRRLNLLSKIGLIEIISGKKNHKANTYSINKKTFNFFVDKLNRFRVVEDRINYINDFFLIKNLEEDNPESQNNVVDRQLEIISKLESLSLSEVATNCDFIGDVINDLMSDNYQEKIDCPQKSLLKIFTKHQQNSGLSMEDIQPIFHIYGDYISDWTYWDSKTN